ncbi:hypothetical protein [Oceanicoccus sp. KOV_DT_Chl]|uniref:hypothetical protein n=1 Tax=Oceanicoccus sp. KOV_DT_Chl TaxID=1904639 RepID=UPI000C7BD0B2|nr:hypothetical protein [Oceanicoccus sp. KOV_DT_Chl]
MKNIMIACTLFMTSVLSTAVTASETGQTLDQTMQPNLVIYRDTDRSAISYRVMVDGKRVGKLSKRAVIGLKLEEGEHVISATDSKRTKLKVVVAAGAVTYVSGDIDKKHRLSLQKVEPSTDAVAALAPEMIMAQIN